ncbi:MAG: EscU/YscU/HrcU family type III secretion system export apparatus switch protein [Oleiphilaceae bacterium]|nr:EscU/YscU/HrcU family type III secretion system export apparatus switch protein [Oleiphilaceae bacterium]
MSKKRQSRQDSARRSPDAAIALRYDGIGAPDVTATGQNQVARDIIELARAHGIPLYEDADLAALLSRLDLGEEVPETLYRVIAEVMAYAFHLQGKSPADVGRKEGHDPEADDPL